MKTSPERIQKIWYHIPKYVGRSIWPSVVVRRNLEHEFSGFSQNRTSFLSDLTIGNRPLIYAMHML